MTSRLVVRATWISLIVVMAVLLFLGGLTVARLGQVSKQNDTVACTTNQLREFSRQLTAYLTITPDQRDTAEGKSIASQVAHAFDETC